LPNYDEYVVAHKDRAPLLGAGLARQPPREGGLLGTPSVLCNGKLVGSWSRTIEKGSVRIELTLREAPDRATRAALRAEAERYAVFLGSALRLVIAVPAKRRA